MADFTITLECNNKCRFCVRELLRDVYIEQESLANFMRCSPDKQNVVLTGGEVTILPNILKITALCRECGYRKIGIITNGRRLSDCSFLESLVKSGVGDIAVSIYSTRENIHDALTGVTGSCKETLAGIRNIIRIKDELSSISLAMRVNILINTKNFPSLKATFSKLHTMGVRDFLLLNLIGVEDGRLIVGYDDIIKLYSELSLESNFNDCNFTFRGFPPCVFADFIESFRGNRFDMVSRNNAHIQCELQIFDTHGSPHQGKMKQYNRNCKKLYRHYSFCKGCLFEKTCIGVPEIYRRSFPHAELKKIPAE